MCRPHPLVCLNFYSPKICFLCQGCIIVVLHHWLLCIRREKNHLKLLKSHSDWNFRLSEISSHWCSRSYTVVLPVSLEASLASLRRILPSRALCKSREGANFFLCGLLPALEFFSSAHKDEGAIQNYVLFCKRLWDHISAGGGEAGEPCRLRITLQFLRSYVIGVLCVHRAGHWMLIY